MKPTIELAKTCSKLATKSLEKGVEATTQNCPLGWLFLKNWQNP